LNAHDDQTELERKEKLLDQVTQHLNRSIKVKDEEKTTGMWR